MTLTADDVVVGESVEAEVLLTEEVLFTEEEVLLLEDEEVLEVDFAVEVLLAVDEVVFLVEVVLVFLVEEVLVFLVEVVLVFLVEVLQTVLPPALQDVLEVVFGAFLFLCNLALLTSFLAGTTSATFASDLAATPVSMTGLKRFGAAQANEPLRATTATNKEAALMLKFGREGGIE